MTNPPKIELKSIKHNERMSDETHCYSARLFVDGKLWGEVSNRGHGGSDEFHGLNGRNHGDIAKLNARIAATMPAIEAHGFTLEQSLEMICCGLVNDWLRDRDFDKAMSRKVLFLQPGKSDVFQISLRRGDAMADVLAMFRVKHPEWTFLADMPAEQAKEVYFRA